jgi:uncharacterized membrane protein
MGSYRHAPAAHAARVLWQQDGMMNNGNLPPVFPILRILAAFPIAGFCGALVTDIAYAATADMIWADFSAWLLAAALVAGVVAALAGLVDVIVSRRISLLWTAWPLVIGGLLALVLGLADNLVHSRDAWTSVVPAGLALSAATVLVTLITAWSGGSKAARINAMGVRP